MSSHLYKKLYFLFTLALFTTAMPVLATWHDSDELLAQLKQVQKQHNIPKMAIVLMDAGEALTSHTFSLNRAEEPTDNNTPFRLGSITKTFTALSLLKLVDQGKLSLDAKLADHLPTSAFQNPWKAESPMRAIQLLEHSSGLSDLSGKEFSFNEALSLGQALAVNPENRVARWEPGTRHSYSNVNPGLTSLLIEKVSGENFETRTLHLIRSLGMPQADFSDRLGSSRPLPGGFKADGETPIPYWEMTFRAFGALNASAKEMSNFLYFLLNQGHTASGSRPLKPESFEKLFNPRSTLAAEAGLTVGYGAGLYGWIHNGQILYGHGGDADGYLSRYGIHRPSGRGYFIVINTDNPSALRKLRSLIENDLSKDLKRSEAPASQLDTKQLQTYTGRYYPSTTRFGYKNWADGKKASARVTFRDKHLIFSYRGKSQALYPITEQLFRRAGDPVATLAFVYAKDGSLYLQGELGEFVQMD